MSNTYRKFDWNRARSDFATLFTDFNEYAAGDWVITTVEAGAGSATEALAAGPGGLLLVTNDAADNDADHFQWAGGSGAVAETFKYVADKKLQFVMRFKMSRIDVDFMAGLFITDTDPIGGVSDGIYFRKLVAEAGLQLVVEKNATESVTTVLTTVVADTWYTIEFYHDGGGASDDKIKAYVNGALAGSAPVTNAPDDEDLALSFGIQNGSANAAALTVDYIGASQQR